MASSDSGADELAVPKDRLQLLLRAVARVERTHAVTVTLLPTTPELDQQWVRVEGSVHGRDRAKDYIKALCSPEVEMDIKYSRPLHCIWTGAGGVWHRAVENTSGAAVMVMDVGTLRVSGTDLQVMMAISTLENLQTVYKDSDKEAATRENLDQDRRFRRLLQTIGDGSTCDEQLQDLPSVVKQLLMEWMEDDAEDTPVLRNSDSHPNKNEIEQEESSDSSFEVMEREPPMETDGVKSRLQTDAVHQEDAVHVRAADVNIGAASDMREEEASNIPSDTGPFPCAVRTRTFGCRAEAVTGFSVEKPHHHTTTGGHDHENVRFLKNFAARLQISENLVDQAIADLGSGVDVNTMLDYIEKLQSNENVDVMEMVDDKQQKRPAASDDDIVEIPVTRSKPLTTTPQGNEAAMQSTSKVNRREHSQHASDVSVSKGHHYEAVKPHNQDNVRFLKKFGRDLDIDESLVDRAIADLGSEVDVNTMLDHIGKINSGDDAVVMEIGDGSRKQQSARTDDDDVAMVEAKEDSGKNSEDISSSCKICRDLGYDDVDIALAVSRVGEEASLPALLQEIRTIIEEKGKERKKGMTSVASNSKAGETVLLPQTSSILGGNARNRTVDTNLKPQTPNNVPSMRYIPPLRQQPFYINQPMVRPVVLLPAPPRGMVRPYHSLAADVQAQNQHPGRNRARPSASQSTVTGSRDNPAPKQTGRQFQDFSKGQEKKAAPNQSQKSQVYKLDLPDGPGDDTLRPVVIDGSNVAMSHGKRGQFSSRGIALCVEYFWKRGHRDITVFVPNFRKGASEESHLLLELEEKGVLSFTPSRRIKGKTVASYDDRYIVRLAAENGGVIVSNDNYRDLMDESEAWRDVIENRLLLFTMVGDRFMPPDDPLGRDGPTLEDFLRKPAQKKHRAPSHKASPQRPTATHTGGGNNLPAPAAAPISQDQLQLYQQLQQVFPGQEEKIQRVLQMHPEMADLNAVSAMVLDVDV